MGALNKEQIQFINNYLDNSNVIYADIRTEMVDHVASEIEEIINNGDERNFYYIFKDYMIENKSKLLQNNKKFLKTADKKIRKALFKNLFSPAGLVTIAVFFAVLYLAFQYYSLETFKDLLFAVPLVIFLIFGLVYWIALRRYKLERFSAVERISLPLVFIFHFFVFLNNTFFGGTAEESKMLYIILTISIILSVMVALFRVTIQLAKGYQKRFKNLTVL
ncbi:hypothetical protein [Winogradskyella aurantia]|uniref:Uncharacterized protein n=1 Tax=Winogradskyella aurantia TaxID=1915063 RepID=A0A265UZS7_9FLAO|nr:hypothetical protein [Winogradskyella aurantia]OZV70801.1 hypothetical protein CA834_01420 [Winogradskyella aurantia]